MITAADVAAFSGHRLIAYYWQAGYAYEVLGTSLMTDDAWDSLVARLRREWDDLPCTEHRDKICKRSIFESTSFLGQADKTPTICRAAAKRRVEELQPKRGIDVTEQSANKIEKAIGAYHALREQRAQLKAEFDEIDKDLKAKMEALEFAMLKHMDAVGTSQLKTAAGMAYVETSKTPTCGDWQALYKYIAENERFDLLQRRLGAQAVKDLEAETGELPPGVTMLQERVVRFRAPGSKA